MTSVGSVDHPVIAFDVATYNFGVSLGSLLVDYSVLRMEETESKTTSTVRLITGSLMVKKVILTVSKRTEDSDRDAYNFETKLLTPKKIKEDFFGGIQINATKHLMLGILYNYYQFHEYSLTATLFF